LLWKKNPEIRRSCDRRKGRNIKAENNNESPQEAENTKGSHGFIMNERSQNFDLSLYETHLEKLRLTIR